MEVEFSGISRLPEEIKEVWIDRIASVMDSGTYIGGRPVESFEESWAKTCKAQFAIGVSNGFDGLVLALKALGIGAGHRIAIPAHTFIATWNAAIAVGATPIGVDIDRDGLLDLEKFHEIAPEVDVVIPVHMHGCAVDMSAIQRICKDSRLKSPIKIIEDASQAHGAVSPDGSALGKYSDMVVYSLYPTKNLGGIGDCGVITTNKVDFHDRLKLLRNYGSASGDKYLHLELGFNSRLDTIQAAVLEENLKLLPSWNSRRRLLSELYIKELLGWIEVLQSSRSDSVRHHLCVLTPRRDDLRKFLFSKGVGTEIHYPNVAGTEASRFLKLEARFPRSEVLASQTLSLPLSQWHTEEQINYVAFQIKSWMNR
jgi:dTDP-4-amino-4,6-dideoxygalactose transaminase